MLSSSTSEQAVEEALPDDDNSVYRATRRRCAGGMFLSSSPCCIPPWRTPTRIIESHCGIRRLSMDVAEARQGRTHIMRSVGVVVDATEEHSGSILADVLQDQVATTRMLVDQLRYIVDEASDDDQRPLQRLLPDCNIE